MKKVFLFALFSLLALGLMACGGGDDDGWVDPSEYGDGEAYVEIDDENVTSITVFKNDWAEFNNAAQQNSPIYQQLVEKIGCDIEAMNSSSGTWETQLSLLQAEEDLPDIFITNGPDNSFFFDKLIRNGDIISISDWVSEEHYPNIYNYIQQFNFLRSNVSYGDGEMWFIPSTWHNEKSLYVRIDWIDNLNAKLDTILVKEGVVSNASEITDDIREQWKFKIPETLLDFYRLARAFTLYDPDNDGANDTKGYVSESNKDMDAWIYTAFDAGWNQFIAEDGSYTYSDISDNAMYATQFMTRLIAEGYCSADSLTGDIDGKQTKFMNGQAGMMFAHNWYNVIVSGMMAADNCSIETATSRIAMVEPPKGKDGSHGAAGEKGFWQGFCINANMSNARIRKCLELYDYLLSDEGYRLLQYGVEGTHYTEDAEGNLTNLIPVDEYGFRPSINQVDAASMLYALVDWTMNYNNKIGTNADIITARQAVSERNSSFSDYPCVTGKSYAEYMDSCHNLFLETIVLLEKNEKNYYYTPKDATTYNPTTFGWEDLYTVERAFESKWKSFVKTYTNDSYGGAKIISEFNEIINAGNVIKVSKDDYIYNSGR